MYIDTSIDNFEDLITAVNYYLRSTDRKVEESAPVDFLEELYQSGRELSREIEGRHPIKGSTSIPLSARQMTLLEVEESTVPVNSIFIDEADHLLKFKNYLGTVASL